jgi:hypothetical protein
MPLFSLYSASIKPLRRLHEASNKTLYVACMTCESSYVLALYYQAVADSGAAVAAVESLKKAIKDGPEHAGAIHALAWHQVHTHTLTIHTSLPPTSLPPTFLASHLLASHLLASHLLHISPLSSSELTPRKLLVYEALSYSCMRP